jgi:1-acyl-sn-glycerol-3-phosphate acyltransferase
MYKLPLVFRWVSKREVLKMPFIGWLLALHGDVLIKRGSTSSTKAMLKDCKAWLDKKVSIAIFPEGTRTKDGQIHDFKEGAFLLAKVSKVAILPVVVNGTYETTKKFALPFRQKFDLHILHEISEEEVASTSIKEMTQRVHNMIAEKHGEIAPHLYSTQYLV